MATNLEYPKEYILTKVNYYGSTSYFYGIFYDKQKGTYREYSSPHPDYHERRFKSVEDAKAYLKEIQQTFGLYTDCTKAVFVAEDMGELVHKTYGTTGNLVILGVPPQFYYGKKWYSVLQENRKLDHEPKFRRGDKCYLIKEGGEYDLYDKIVGARIEDIDVISDNYYYDFNFSAPYYSAKESDWCLRSIADLENNGKFFYENGRRYYRHNNGTVFNAERADEV